MTIIRRQTPFILLLAAAVLAVALFLGLGPVAPNVSAEDGNSAGKSADAKPSAAAAQKGKSLPLVVVETVSTATLSKTMSLTGTVTPTRLARVASPVEGPVEGIEGKGGLVREGDEVKKGQVLFRIGRDKGALAQLAAAEQALTEQEQELARVEQLVKNGAIPGFELDAARSKHENARAQLSKAAETSADYSVTAPWDGIVSKVYVAEGDYVAPRAPLIEIFDPTSLVVMFTAPESRAIEVKREMPVLVTLDAHPGRAFNGKISRAYPRLDEQSRTRTLEAVLIDPAALLPGMFARIQVMLAEIPDAVTVPVQAVLATSDGTRVAFVSDGEKAKRRKVETGIEENGRIQILSGLLPGERVIVSGQDKLQDGAAIREPAASTGSGEAGR